MSTLAERIGDLRSRAGLTKTALAKPRYTVSYVSQIEAGRRTPSPDAMAYFADRLGVSAKFLSTGIPEDLEEQLRYRLEEARERLRSGDADGSLEALSELRERARAYGITGLHEQVLVLIGEALMQAGRVQEAIDLYEEALEGQIPARDAGLAVAGLARAYRSYGDLSYGIELIEGFLTRHTDGPLDPSTGAELQLVLVSLYSERGDFLRAERAARRALAVASEGASMELRAKAYWSASRVLSEAHRWDEALEYATRARVLMEELDDRRNVARLHNAYAFICLESDPPKLEDAREHLERAEVLLAEAAAPGDLAYVLEERGRLFVMEGRADEALDSAEQALAFSEDNEFVAANALLTKGRALAALERREDARGALRAAADSFRRQGARQLEVSCWRELGQLDLAEGNLQAAADALRAGLQALEPQRGPA